MIKRLAPLLSAVLLALAACGGDGPTLRDLVPVAAVRLDAGADSVLVGRVLQLSAIAVDASGRELVGRPITWVSASAQQVATISASGLVTGLLPGEVTFTATSGGVSASMTVRVRPVPVASVTVTPATTSVTAGATVHLAAMPRDAAGNLLTNRPPTWSTSDAAIAQVSATGLVAGVAPGQVTITANVDGRTGNSVVTVLPMPVTTVEIAPNDVLIFAGATQALTAVARGAGGVALTGRAVQWSSANPAVATVSATGVVTGVSPGTTFVTATVEGKTAQGRVIVRTP